MDTHGLVRDARVLEMVIVLAMITYSLVLSTIFISASNSALPLQCVYQSPSSFPNGDPVATIMGLHFVLSLLGAGYAGRIQDLYFEERHPALLPVLLWWKLMREDAGRLNLRERFAELMAERRLSRIRSIRGYTGLWDVAASQLTNMDIRSSILYRTLDSALPMLLLS